MITKQVTSRRVAKAVRQLQKLIESIERFQYANREVLEAANQRYEVNEAKGTLIDVENEING